MAFVDSQTQRQRRMALLEQGANQIVGGLENYAKFDQAEKDRKMRQDAFEYEKKKYDDALKEKTTDRAFERFGLGLKAAESLGDTTLANTYGPSVFGESYQPMTYDFGKTPKGKALEVEKQQQDAKFKFESDQKKLDRENNLKIAGMKVDAVKSKPPKPGANLEPDAKVTINTLATKNANINSIKSALDSFMASAPNLTKDQFIVQGRQLLKTLNSPQGADAIGAEEAKRLGGLLEFQIGNFTNPGPVVGRDLKGFSEQVAGTSKLLGDTVNRNTQIINQAKGGPAPVAAPNPQDEYQLYLQLKAKRGQ